MNHPLRRPHWLPLDDWHKLLGLHGNAPRCIDCGTTDYLSVDHIIPRKYSGTDDLSNLCFRCVPHNSAKGVRGDGYWKRSFYWDQVPEVIRWRTTQRRIMELITLDPQVSDWFSQPASVIAGRLYLVAAIVGSGKTLAIPAVAHAYNMLQRRNWAATRRADRILILTKEQGIRDEIVRSLRKDIPPESGYGLLPHAPVVSALEQYDDLRNETWVGRQDAVVACIQMFWDKKGQPKKDIIEMLGKFSLIFLDETHFGHSQVQKIIEAAPRSVVFGMTGSPIRKDASLFRDFVLLSEYTYQDAHEHDQSLKYLTDDEDERDRFVTGVQMLDADVLASGQERTVSQVTDPDYDPQALVVATNVASAAVRWLERCDAALPGTPAPHRDPDRVVADLMYPAHLIIRCENIAMAKMLQKVIQAHLERTRREHPERGGWNARHIFVGDGETPGERMDPEKHPWMRAYRRGVDPVTLRYSCHAGDARILIVVGMAREGVNNPLCCVTAQVDGKGSVVLSVQGLLGRALRAVSYVDSDGIRHVPPAILDTPHVFYHQSHQNTATAINDGIGFLCNMHEHFEGLLTIGDLISGKAAGIELDPKAADSLSSSAKLDIAVSICEAEGDDWRGREDDLDRIIKDAVTRYAPQSEDKARRVAEWIRGPLLTDPESTWRMTGHVMDLDEITPVPVVLDEREKVDPTPEQVSEYIKWNRPEYVHMLDDPSGNVRELLKGYYLDWVRANIMPQVESDDSLEGIRRAFTREIKHFYRRWLEGDEGKFNGAAHSYIAVAVQHVLGVPGEKIEKNSRWDCPQVHVLLQRPDIKNVIQGYAKARLLRDGYCPAVTRALGGDPHE